MTVGVNAAASARLISIDSETRGDWVGTYGGEGYIIITADNSLQSIPSYANVTYENNLFWTWADYDYIDPNDRTARNREPGALFKNADKSSRLAACYYNGGYFTVHIDIGEETKVISLYMHDYDEGVREAEVSVYNEKGAELTAPVEIISYAGGVYLRYKVSGKVEFMFESLYGANVVLSGIFFDPESEADIIRGEAAKEDIENINDSDDSDGLPDTDNSDDIDEIDDIDENDDIENGENAAGERSGNVGVLIAVVSVVGFALIAGTISRRSEK